MLLELVQDSELWVVLPNGTNVRIDCRGKGPAVVEHWHRGQLKQAMELVARPKRSQA
jgi:hypothetical protein